MNKEGDNTNKVKVDVLRVKREERGEKRE